MTYWWVSTVLLNRKITDTQHFCVICSKTKKPKAVSLRAANAAWQSQRETLFVYGAKGYLGTLNNKYFLAGTGPLGYLMSTLAF